MNGLGAAMVNAMVKGVTVTIEGEVGWNGKNIQQQRTQQAMLWRVVMMVRQPLVQLLLLKLTICFILNFLDLNCVEI